MKQSLQLVAVLTMAFLVGCGSQPGVKDMQSKNNRLQADLDQARAKIVSLESTEEQLQSDISNLKRVMGVLDTEKTVRTNESSSLRGEVREFVQGHIDDFKSFLVKSDLLDYVGGELVQRSQVDKSNMLLVDLDHPMPSNGTITGVSAHFIKPATFTVQVMRRVDKSLVTIWQSNTLQAAEAGVRRIHFPVSVGVEKGDIIGYYFNEAGVISYDEGTGNTRYYRSSIGLGEIVKVTSLKGAKEQRAYSVGVYGLLN